MNTYQTEQIDALKMIRSHLETLKESEINDLKSKIADYLAFRSKIALFLETHFKDICTEKCYHSRLSACCSKDGIIAFFADVVVNALCVEKGDLDRLEKAIEHPAYANKCIFLSQSGCLWHVKPIVCEMFLCDEAEGKVFGNDPDLLKTWEAFKETKKSYAWPDQPVLFEALEYYFMSNGFKSPLMYIHTSPGLMRIKQNREE